MATANNEDSTSEGSRGDSLVELNRKKVIDFFRSGSKPREQCTHLGVEVEHFVMGPSDTPVYYEPHDGLPGVRQILEHLRIYYPEPSYSASGALIGLLGEEGSVTLEPAAQLELSCAPYSSVADIEKAFNHFYQHVDEFLAPSGCRLVARGYHPTARAFDLPLIPKRRYGYMNDYFAHIHSHGERMMRGSASTQVSVDFFSEADAVRKMRVAAALSPVLAAIMDNTHVFEGETNQTPIRRLQLWREVDGRRCGTPKGLFNDGFGFASYADWLLATPPIFVDRPAASDPKGPDMRGFYEEPAAEAYADAPMSKSDVEHLISMFWPDVRLKRFVEVRPADSVPLPLVLGYTALIKGLFYSEDSLGSIERDLGVSGGHWPITAEEVNEAIRSIQAAGFAATVYGRSLATWEHELFSLARAALPDDEKPYLEPLESFAHDKSWWRTAE